MSVLLELDDTIQALREARLETDVGAAVQAVIHAVSPWLKLRSYLEGKIKFTLIALRQILGAHYAEKDETVLYEQLTKAVQGSNETSLDFLIRVLDLCQ